MESYATYKKEIDEYVTNAVKIATDLYPYLVPQYFAEAIKHASEGGKRLRGILALVIYDDICLTEQIKVERKTVLDFAAGIEILHAYTLVHDDMPCMDNDSVRRGKPSVHAKYGEATALLVGDELQALGYALTFRAFCSANQARYFENIPKRFSGRGLIGGQIAEVEFVKNAQFFAKDKQEAQRTQINTLKTTELFSCVCEGICNILQPKDGFLSVYLAKFATYFGNAFQIKDDIEDFLNGQDAGEFNYCEVVGLDAAKSVYKVVLKLLDGLFEDSLSEMPLLKMLTQIALPELD
ncbi:MAG: polyprenyl synthetase family protein [Christensenellaceae bacterium]|jgi:geranylgeranyl pyrophosphate synthase|nr:polyprenyl synthetase family protein [Christensenellaceae bacterium]